MFVAQQDPEGLSQRGSSSGDFLQIVVAFNDSLTNVSPIGHIIKDSKSLLTAITEDLYAHFRQQANTVAHRLAGFSLNTSSHLD